MAIKSKSGTFCDDLVCIAIEIVVNIVWLQERKLTMKNGIIFIEGELHTNFQVSMWMVTVP